MKEPNNKKSKRKVVIALAITITLLAIVLVITIVQGKPPEQPRLEDADETLLQMAKQTYLNTSGTDKYLTTEAVTVQEYCGIYDGCVVAKVTDGQHAHAAVVTSKFVAGILFVYPDTNEICAWKDGVQYTLEEAYRAKILSWWDIQDIAYIHHKYY